MKSRYSCLKSSFISLCVCFDVSSILISVYLIYEFGELLKFKPLLQISVTRKNNKKWYNYK